MVITSEQFLPFQFGNEPLKFNPHNSFLWAFFGGDTDVMLCRTTTELPRKQSSLFNINNVTECHFRWSNRSSSPNKPQYLAGQVSRFDFLSNLSLKQVLIFLTMCSPKNAFCNLLFASASISLLLGPIASPIIGDEQSWATLREPEFLAYEAPDAANLPNLPSTPDTGADWTSLTALLNNGQLGNTAAEVFVPQQQEKFPYLISDSIVRGTAPPPEPRGPPKPLRPNLKE